MLSKEHRVAGGNTVELTAQIVDDEQVAIGPVRVAQAKVDTNGILFDGIHLREHGARQEAVKRVAGVE